MAFVSVESLALLRTLVGYLGEREQHTWWQSSFFGPGSKAFLTPVFGKTHLLARCTGVTQAAALIHDERIGVGNVYHLFRLPEDLEQSIHRALHEPALLSRIEALVTSSTSALAHLRALASGAIGDGVGPTRIGSLSSLRTTEGWAVVAAHYGQAFANQTQIYPYFSDKAA